MTNSEEWEVACVRAGRSSGDLAHPLVYCPELHFSEFTSAVADMKNSVAVSDQSKPNNQMAQDKGPKEKGHYHNKNKCFYQSFKRKKGFSNLILEICTNVYK